MRLALLALLLPTMALADTSRETQTAADRLVSAIKRHDVRTIDAMLATPFRYDAVWFSDAACSKRFAAGGVVKTADRNAFARCLTKLVPQLSTRKAPTLLHAVVTVDPGIELDVEFDVTDESAPKITWVGLAGLFDGSATPMLTAQAFEALRTAGTTMLDDAVRADFKRTPATTSAWMRTCLDDHAVATRTIVWSSTPETGAAFLRATADWAFKPFAPRGVATAACSLSLLTYPASTAPMTEVLPMRPGLASVGVHNFEDDLELTGSMVMPSIATIQQAELLALSSGTLDPKPATQQVLLHTPRDRRSTINICIDTRGTVRNVVAIDRKPGDTARLTKIRSWKFRPYKLNGLATDACAVVQFVLPP